MQQDERVRFLEQSKLFEKTPAGTLQEIAKVLRHELVSAGEDIVQRGQAADRLYLVVSGSVSVHEGGRELRVLGAGGAFGEMGLLDDQPRAATVSAIEPSQLLSLGRAEFLTLVSSRPEVSQAILLTFVANLRGNVDAMTSDFAYRLELERRVQEQLRDLAAAQLAMIFALSKLSESRDTDTGLHLERVREYTRILATELAKRPGFEALDPETISTIVNASPLHDIGKVGIPDSILKKPGKLEAEEFEVMKTHTTLGAETLRSVIEQYPGNRLVSLGLEIALNHHEKWDGSGYPAGRSGTDIPLSARIVALADVYDALSSRRPYKEPFPRERVTQMVTEGRGTHFDPAIVDAFLAVETAFAEIAKRLGGNGAA